MSTPNPKQPLPHRVCPTCFRVLETTHTCPDEPLDLPRAERISRRIRSLLKLHQISIRRIAITLRVSDSFIHQVISRQRRNHRVESHIAKLLEPFGFTYHELWGRTERAG